MRKSLLVLASLAVALLLWGCGPGDEAVAPEKPDTRMTKEGADETPSTPSDN